MEMMKFLSIRGLSKYYGQAKVWAEENGAAPLGAVDDELDDLAEYLKLTEEERKTLKKEPQVTDGFM